MSARYFCDICGTEMTDSDHKRVCRSMGDLRLEIMTGYKNGTNNGHLCHSCIIRAVNEGEPTKPMLSGH